MKLGYARTSTVDQVAGLEAQERDLKVAGAERIFSEQVSSVARRVKLEELIAFARDGDTVIVTKPDRLARSVRDLMGIVDKLKEKRVNLHILSLGMDTGSPTARLMLTLLGGIAEFERELMLERQREGIARAKAERKYKGRAPTARARAGDIEALAAKGFGPLAISKELKISRSSVYRVMEHAGIDKKRVGSSDVD